MRKPANSSLVEWSPLSFSSSIAYAHRHKDLGSMRFRTARLKEGRRGDLCTSSHPPRFKCWPRGQQFLRASGMHMYECPEGSGNHPTVWVSERPQGRKRSWSKRLSDDTAGSCCLSNGLSGRRAKTMWSGAWEESSASIFTNNGSVIIMG